MRLPDELAVLDRDQADSLRQFLPRDRVDALYRKGIEGADKALVAIAAAIAARDAETYGREGHTAKGMFGNLGLARCAAVARTIELRGKSGLLDEAEILLADLQTEVAVARATVEAWLEESA
jgi:HPt (histidine-containing phosphotransfer) domain-containing protein